MVGQVKSVKTVLKQLQQSIQTITAPGWPADEEMNSVNPADNFQWLSRDHLCILVYLVTVMHSMQVIRQLLYSQSYSGGDWRDCLCRRGTWTRPRSTPTRRLLKSRS